MAADRVKINVQARTETGKGAARRARREDLIPAVLYGHGSEPRHILMPGHETMLALRNPNQLLDIVEGSETEIALAKDIQRHPLRPEIQHVDLIVVKRGEKVVVDVPVVVEGEVAPGFTYILEEATVPVEADALDLPESVTINIEGREAGDHVLANQVELPEGAALELEDDYVIATVDLIVEQDLGEEGAEGEAAEEAAEDAAAEDSEGDED